MRDAQLRLAAFGHPPGAATGEATAFTVATDFAAPDRQRWLAAVVLGGHGRYAAAAALLVPMITGPDPVFAALAASTLASHRRQLGCHVAARALDSTALGRLAMHMTKTMPADPDGIDADGALHDTFLGLAADAVGCGRTDEAHRLIAVAAERGVASWRGRVRACWLAAEVCLADRQPGRAVRVAKEGVREAQRVGALRHIVKSQMVMAVSLATEGTQSGRLHAVDLLEAGLATSLDRGFWPLAWPTALLLADICSGSAEGYLGLARHALSCVFRRSDGRSRALAQVSPWMSVALRRTGEDAATDV